MYIWVYISAMTRRYSIAQARANLPTIVDEVESGAGVELTRRGKPVAVMLSVEQYARLRGERTDFKEAYARFLATHRLAQAGVEPGFAARVRDRSAERKVSL